MVFYFLKYKFVVNSGFSSSRVYGEQDALRDLVPYV